MFVLLQCAFYFMNVAIDTTLGVYIAYLLLQLVTALAVRSFMIYLLIIIAIRLVAHSVYDYANICAGAA